MVKTVSEFSTDMESTSDIVKYINQQKDEIILAIKRDLVNLESPATQTEDHLGKLRSFLFRFIFITNNYLYLVSGR